MDVDLVAYRNDAVVERFARDQRVDLGRARGVFEELKDFLRRAAASASPLEPPSEEVDGMWHTFLLFTREYATFCSRFFGKFIHHTPKAAMAMAGGGCTSDQGGSQDSGGGDCNADGNA